MGSIDSTHLSSTITVFSHQKVGPVAGIQMQALIRDGQYNLGLNSESRRFQFMNHAGLVHAFQDTWPDALWIFKAAAMICADI
jgi:hypothetical protein